MQGWGWGGVPLPNLGRGRGLGAKPRCRRQRADAKLRRCDFVARASPCTSPHLPPSPDKRTSPVPAPILHSEMYFFQCAIQHGKVLVFDCPKACVEACT